MRFQLEIETSGPSNSKIMYRQSSWSVVPRHVLEVQMVGARTLTSRLRSHWCHHGAGVTPGPENRHHGKAVQSRSWPQGDPSRHEALRRGLTISLFTAAGTILAFGLAAWFTFRGNVYRQNLELQTTETYAKMSFGVTSI